MPKAPINNLQIEYETIGDPSAKPLLLIAGLGSQLIAWPDDMCNTLSNRGFFVIRFDNRDIGLSTKLKDTQIPDFAKISEVVAQGQIPNVPYTLYDMADDAIGVLDALNVEKAHICGASMGGMIAQIIAYRHPTRIHSLTVIMSTTGNPNLPQAKPEFMAQFFAPVPSEKQAYVEELVKRGRLTHGTYPYNEDLVRAYRTQEYNRSYYPLGSVRQLAAMAVPGNLKPNLGMIQAPTLVIHGQEDPFYPVEAGKDIANSIPDAELLILEGMGHSLPNEVIPRIIDALVTHTNKNH